MDSCSKIPHSSVAVASLALRASQRRSAARGRKSPTGAYFCGPCHRWHPTSKSPARVPERPRPKPTGEPSVLPQVAAAGVLHPYAASRRRPPPRQQLN